MALVLQRQDLLDRAALAVFFRGERRVVALFFSIASACIGMSGRVVASGAGDRSSVLVSPGTLNTVMVRLCGTSGLLVRPLGLGPALQHGLGVGVAGLRLLLHVMERIKHQQGVLQAIAAMAPTLASSSSWISGATL